jgi:hypothetical protein
MAGLCVICGRSLSDKRRSDAKTCSARCRKALSRSRQVVALAPAPGLPDRGELLRLLAEQARRGSTRATLELLRLIGPEEPEQPGEEPIQIGALIAARLAG